jgi:hypothetical protein
MIGNVHEIVEDQIDRSKRGKQDRVFSAVKVGRFLSKQAGFKMTIWAFGPHMPTDNNDRGIA